MPALTPEQARRVYDRIGRAQDWQRFYEDAATAELVAHADFDTAHAVVELGCGTGRFAAALLAGYLPADASYVGVDLSPRMVALASDRLGPWRHRAAVTLVDGGATLPAADGGADRFVANYVFDLLGPEETRRRSRRGAPGARAGWAAVRHRPHAGRERTRTLRVARVDGRVGALARPRRRLPPDPARRRAEPGRVAGPPSPHGRGLGREAIRDIDRERPTVVE